MRYRGSVMKVLRYALLLALLLATKAPNDVARRRPLDLAELELPPGFVIERHVQGLSGPRFMAFSPTGVLFVSEMGAGRIRAIPEPGRLEIFASGLRQPHGLAFRGNDLYVAENHRIIVYRNATNPSLRGTTPEVVADLPSVGGGHSTRSILFTPEGKLLATAGSTCNVCNETDPRRAAAMLFNADGSGMEIFSRGLRNSVGIAVHPATGEVWSVDNGRDNLGDDLPPEEINILRPGGDYGWPRCYGDRRRNPEYPSADCSSTLQPELEMQAHSAPLSITFYTGDTFPARYLHDAFAGFHGSWNRNEPTGYKVSRVLASSGRAAGIEDFVGGFLRAGTTSGRPVGVLTGPDGALYVSDDLNGVIYRVSYRGPRLNPGGAVSAAAATGVAPGALVSLYGKNLKAQELGAASLPLPLNLEDVSVTVAGRAVPLLYAGPQQVNFQMPFGVHGRVPIALTNGVTTDLLEVEVRTAAPAIFTQDQSGSGLGAIRVSDQALEIYCTGLGEVDQPVAAGAAAPSSPLAHALAGVTVTIDGWQVDASFAGLAPGYAGLYQVNAPIPAGARRGSRVLVVLTAGGAASNVVEVVLP